MTQRKEDHHVTLRERRVVSERIAAEIHGLIKAEIEHRNNPSIGAEGSEKALESLVEAIAALPR